MHSKVAEQDAEQEQTDLRKLINISSRYNGMRQEILWTLSEFAYKWDGHLGTIQTVKHRIELNTASILTLHLDKRPWRPPRPLHPISSSSHLETVRKRVNRKNDEDERDRTGSVRVASPISFAPIKDGVLRFCVDYRKPNALTVRDASPIPRMD